MVVVFTLVLQYHRDHHHVDSQREVLLLLLQLVKKDLGKRDKETVRTPVLVSTETCMVRRINCSSSFFRSLLKSLFFPFT